MSGPFRFNQETAKSPLDRSASPFSAGQPVSFKTNVNRMKTKKWVQAKKNAYDGDDWGDYDEYDEYGVNNEPQPEPEAPSAQRYYAQRVEQPGRSFTDPSQQAPLPKARRNSFEHGEEQRAFSSTIPHPQQDYGQDYGESQWQPSGAGPNNGHDPQQQRDFSPSAMPTPLQTRISAVPTDMSASPSHTQFPPRKSSIGQAEAPMATSPRSRTGSQSDKPLPFIRPADIYRRVEEERERERASLDSSRPSLDSLSSRPKDEVASPQLEGGRSLQPLETVAERKSEYLPEFDAATQQDGGQPAQVASSEPIQPKNYSSFWSRGPQSQAPVSHAPVVTPSDDQGLRSVVDQAFTRSDDQRSIPPTPVSKDSNSEMSRSNTGSTTGISPIMSRVPSSATSALKTRNQAGGEGSTPVIAEEPSETATPVSQPTSAFVTEPTHQIQRKPSPGHSRNFSGSSLPHSGLATPTRGDSPARSPVIAPQQDVPEPKTAQLATDTTEGMKGGLGGPSPAYAARESDIANAMKASPIGATPELRAAQRESQHTFLESHNAQSPIEDVVPRDRSESPSKGRVQALAGKFGDVSHSRRGSTQSNLSRNSVQSWEKSQDNSRAASPTKGSPSKPSSPVKEFRPHLPGQWESYATTAATPFDQGEKDKELALDKEKVSSPLEEVDLTPTTAKRPVTEVGSSNAPDPIAALKDAGAAMVNSIRSTVGLDDTSSDTQQERRATKNHGDVYMPRPLQLDRTESSISSIPPTPPAKDLPESEYAPPPPLKDLKEKTPEPFIRQQRPTLDPQLSTDPSAEDQESDRLRKEIVASLSPIKTSATPAIDPNRSSLLPASPGANRASSILPSEYDSYWADGDHVTPRPSQDVAPTVPEPSPVAAKSPVTQNEDPAKPSLLNRFSWEESTLGGQSQAGSVVEPSKSAQEERVPSPAVERAAEEERQQWSEGLPDPYFGPGHTFTVTKPDPLTEADLANQAPTPPLDSANSLASPTREQTRSPGLHVVNTAVDPEAVDLPPRFSADYSQPPRISQEESSISQQQKEAEAQPPAPLSPVGESRPSYSHEPTAKSPTTDKPLGAREIATITSTQERIATYNKTRDHWANADHGLENWLTSTLDANPELATQEFPLQRPPTGTIRHKHTPSLALLGKLGGSSNHQHQGTEQYNAAGAQVPAGSNSPTTGQPSGPGFGGRVASHQMQAKGKDLLHTAGVLSGKGMTGAKGLFAKGKSRFGRDKAHYRTDSAPSSREASEEPEFITPISRASTAMTTTPEKPMTRASTATDSPNDEKKNRRFSLSSFYRSNRSRSRPNSIALSSNTPSIFGNEPRNTLPRELARALGEDSRPHSYHAPDSWNLAPGVQPSLDQTQATPPRSTPESQNRLGVLPSPAKSAFSSQEKDIEQDIPPVPPLPDTVREGQYLGTSQDDTSHRMLQSVIRYSTPPIPTQEANKLAENPVFDRAGALGPAALGTGKALPPPPTETQQQLAPTSHDQQPPQQLYQAQFPDAVDALPRGHAEIDDEDDLPPQLHHDPLPLATKPQPGEISSARFPAGPSQVDVSDDDDNSTLFRANASSRLQAPSSGPIAVDVSPLMPPIQSSLDDISDEDDGLQTRTGGHDEVGSMSHRQEKHQDSASSENTGIEVMGSGSIPLFSSQRTTDEPVSKPENKAQAQNAPPWNTVDQKYVTGTGLTAKRPSFETELIGGDISPVSAHSSDDDDGDATPKVARGDKGSALNLGRQAKGELNVPKVRAKGTLDPQEGSPRAGPKLHLPEQEEHVSKLSHHSARQIGEIALEVPGPATRDGSLSPGHASPPHLHANAGADPVDHQTRRVSATPFQVVHAVEEYAASNSSLASWDHDSIVAKSHSETSQPDEMRDESDLVTPVAQVPRITQNGPQADEAGTPYDDTPNMATPNGYFRGHVTSANPMHQSQQLQPSTADMTVPERSKSLLSQISAMVSEGGNPISPASSIAGRSTPSTIRRMQRDSSTKTPWAPAQIPEESAATWNDHTPTAKDDDFDLYADHNGIVKDVRDESGQPLRVADAQVPRAAQQSSPPKSGGPAVVAAVDSKNEERPRYSTERPMSFISGPPDQDGKPQDQINQFALQSDAHVPPVPEQFRQQLQQSDAPPIGTAYSVAPPAAIVQHQNHTQPQQQSSFGQPSIQGFVSSNNDFQDANPKALSDEATQAPVTSPPLPPPQESVARPASTERPPMVSQMPQNSQLPVRGPHDPRMYGMAPGQPMFQGLPAHGQMVMPDHDPRAQGQPLGPPSGPRNQYEFQQQMMQLQAKYPRSQGAQNLNPPYLAQQTSAPTPKQHEKSSSKPRLSSVFKGFGGKSHITPQSSTIAKSATNSNLKPLPVDPNRNGSFHSAVSSLSLSRETPSGGRPGEQPGPLNPSNRPPSMGAESHFSQVSQISQGSTRVQPTDSRVDLRKPASPAPFYGIPPQQPPNVAPMPNGQLQSRPQPQAQSQPYHVSTSENQETGKKKRFSTLGGLFSRTGLAGDGLTTKSKISKDEKKALKAQRHSTAPPVQAPVPQWSPQHQQFRPQQHGMAYPPGQVAHHTVPGMQSMGPQFMSPQSTSPVPEGIMQGNQGTQGLPPQRIPQQYQQSQSQSIGGIRPDEGSAYLRTKQLAEEHQAQRIPAQPSGQGFRPSTEASSTSFDHIPLHLRQTSWGPPPDGYYKPDTKQPTADQGAYAASQATQQQALQRRHQEALQEQATYGASQLERAQLQHRQQSTQAQGAYAGSQYDRLQAQQRQQSMPGQSAYVGSQAERVQTPQQQQPESTHEQAAYGASQAERPNARIQREQQISEQKAYQTSLVQRQLAERQRQQPVSGPGGYGPSQDDRLLAQPQRQQPEQQQLHSQHRQCNVQPPLNHRNVSGPAPGHIRQAESPASQRHVSSPLGEPQYEAPPIPAAYNHVSGAFISPRDRQQQPLFSPSSTPSAPPMMDQYGRQYSDPRMPSISPQISAQSMPPSTRTHSDASTVSVVSPISNTPDFSTTSPPSLSQRPQKPRMSSISEVRLQEQPWHMNFPQGATEQEIVRARQRQYMEQQFTTQQQLHAERAARSPSPRSFPHEQSPAPETQRQGGFKELLPRNSPQPYAMSQPVQSSQQEPPRVSDSPHPVQPAPIHPDQAPQPAAYPLPMSPDNIQSPVNPLAGALPPPQLPPKIPHSPMHPMFPPTNQALSKEQQRPTSREPQQYESTSPPQVNQPQYEQPVPDEPPPSYEGPGLPNNGMDKSRPEQPRPPNITTETETGERSRQEDSRQRQPSIGILQHPQPASMAASPQRSSADMGAEALRRQLLQQEEHARMERLQRAQIQRAESERERQEREIARARARELERSASGGGRVGSLRSVAGSRNGGTPGWERRGSTSRPVFELPAVEDDEPSMKATSYPGQEWVPPMWTDD
ncbi:Nn.00g035780.m01.CDS01 [Neocucurbitaria sp. VM-36]